MLQSLLILHILILRPFMESPYKRTRTTFRTDLHDYIHWYRQNFMQNSTTIIWLFTYIHTLVQRLREVRWLGFKDVRTQARLSSCSYLPIRGRAFLLEQTSALNTRGRNFKDNVPWGSSLACCSTQQPSLYSLLSGGEGGGWKILSWGIPPLKVSPEQLIRNSEDWE